MTVVDALILNPNTTQFLAVLATTLGRDKLYRLIQYVSRILVWSFTRNGNVDAAQRFDSLKSALASGRKLMRVFKPLENLQSALNIAHKPFTQVSCPEQLATVTQFGRQIAYASYLALDSVVWLQSAKFLRLDKDKASRISKISSKAWFIGIVLSLVSSSAKLVNLRAQSRRFALQSEVARREGGEKTTEEAAAEEAERRKQGRALLAQRQTIMSQLVTDSLDVWLPANALGYTNLSEGLIGLLGATTSYMALQKAWEKQGAVLSKKK